MIRVERRVVEQEVAEMFEAHETLQNVVEALLLEIGWDARTICAAQEARQKKQEKEEKREAEREAKRESKREAKREVALIRQLAKEQKSEQAEDEKIVRECC